MKMDYFLALDRYMEHLLQAELPNHVKSKIVFKSFTDINDEELKEIITQLKDDNYIYIDDNNEKLTPKGIRFVLDGGYTGRAKREKQKDLLINIGQAGLTAAGLYYLLESIKDIYLFCQWVCH